MSMVTESLAGGGFGGVHGPPPVPPELLPLLDPELLELPLELERPLLELLPDPVPPELLLTPELLPAGDALVDPELAVDPELRADPPTPEDEELPPAPALGSVPQPAWLPTTNPRMSPIDVHEMDERTGTSTDLFMQRDSHRSLHGRP
jgi:hypothetical protein